MADHLSNQGADEGTVAPLRALVCNAEWRNETLFSCLMKIGDTPLSQVLGVMLL